MWNNLKFFLLINPSRFRCKIPNLCISYLFYRVTIIQYIIHKLEMTIVTKFEKTLAEKISSYSLFF